MLEQLVHQPEFSLGQRAENLLVEGDLAGPRLGQELAPGIGQVEPIGPPVLGVGASLDPSGRADPVDEADHVPLGDQEPPASSCWVMPSPCQSVARTSNWGSVGP